MMGGIEEGFPTSGNDRSELTINKFLTIFRINPENEKKHILKNNSRYL